MKIGNCYIGLNQHAIKNTAKRLKKGAKIALITGAIAGTYLGVRTLQSNEVIPSFSSIANSLKERIPGEREYTLHLTEGEEPSLEEGISKNNSYSNASVVHINGSDHKGRDAKYRIITYGSPSTQRVTFGSDGWQIQSGNNYVTLNQKGLNVYRKDSQTQELIPHPSLENMVVTTNQRAQAITKNIEKVIQEKNEIPSYNNREANARLLAGVAR